MQVRSQRLAFLPNGFSSPRNAGPGRPGSKNQALFLSLRRAAVKDGGDCQNRGYYNGNAHCWHTPCQHLERSRRRKSQQDYPRKFRYYPRYSKIFFKSQLTLIY